MNSLNVVILAAGKGTRMYSDLPKVLHKLAGKSLLQHVVDTANCLSPKKIIVVYGHGGDAVKNSLANVAHLDFCLQSPQLGTGHAVQQALPYLEDDSFTLVLYGDVPLIRATTLNNLIQYNQSLSILTQPMADPKGYGRILRNQRQQVFGIVEEKDATPEQRQISEVNTGILAAPTALLKAWLAQLQNNNAQGEYYLTDIVAMAAQQAIPITTASTSDPFEVLGVNNKAQLAELERSYQQQVAAQLLAQGVTLADPARIDVRGELTCERDVEIDVGCIFEGQVHLAQGVKVGAYSIIRQSRIAATTQIAPYSHIDQAEIGENCHIGPFARIRPGTLLENDVHVGNFVEIKNSQIASLSKANHLSYIGDATVGSRVNIGAGTITCNYDGANKFRTVIEDDVFVGSDTQLVAPVTIGKGATIGAGSTITKDTPAGELTLSRVRQVSIATWQRPTKKK